MDINHFVASVEEHPDLEGVGIGKNGDGLPEVVIRHKPSQLMTCFPAGAIEKADWQTLLDVLSGRREPVVLQHMTRVVGYFSRIENWNKSKLGELADRQAGAYALAEA